MQPVTEPPSRLSPEDFLVQVARESWALFKQDAVLLIGASLLAVLVSALTLGILSGTLTVGFVLIVRARRRGESAQVGDVFNFEHFVGGLIAVLLVGLGITVGFMLLVLPGLLVLTFSVFTLHAMAYEDLPAISAIKASFKLVRERLLQVVVLLIATAVINAIGGAVMFGPLLTVPFTLVATTVAYELLTSNQPRALPEQATGPRDGAGQIAHP